MFVLPQLSVYVPSVRLESSSTINLLIHPTGCALVPLCLVSLKSYKTLAFQALENSIGDIFRSGKII